MKTAINATNPAQRMAATPAADFSRKKISDQVPTTQMPGLSAYWRKNTSSLEAAELANLLRALRKVAGHLGDNIGRIEFTGMSTACDHGILIEPEPLMGKYPVPAEKVDFLVGLVVHEAMHRIEWSDHVWKLLEPEMDKMTPREKVIFQKFVFTGENIYKDFRAEPTVFGLYTRIVRDKAIGLDRCKFSKAGPCVDILMVTWLESAFDKRMNSGTIFDDDPILVELEQVSGKLKTNALGSAGVIRRCEKRADLYRHAWENLASLFKNMKIVDMHLHWFSYLKKSRNQANVAAGQGAGKTKKPPLILIQDIEKRLCEDAVDLTPLIRSVAGYDNDSVAPMSRWDFQAASHPVVDRKMIGRLKSVFAHYADRNSLMSRGLERGRIDRRRLHRAGVDGRCFKTVDRIPNPDWNVGLLVDASGSMRGNKWQMVENTIATIHKALSGYRNRLSAWAYFEVSGICMISRLISKNRLFSVPPAGQTASGQAIIAAASMMPENIKRNLLIHITDGESNFGCDVSFGMEYCRKRNIQLITLGCGYRDRLAMEHQYGRSIQFIDYFEQLPDAMETLFRWTFVYGGEKFRLNINQSGAA